jgi:microcystin-dependent protein
MTNLQDFTNRSEVGTIKPWGKTTAPSGYLLCDGTAVSRTTYAELYVVLGDTYGAGNGSTTFNVPQLQGKTPQGYDGNTYNLAATGGANTVTVAVTNNQAATNTVTNNQAVTVTGSISNTSLTTAQLASHDHDYVIWFQNTVDPGRGPGQGGQQEGFVHPQSPRNTENSGSGTGHNHAHTLAGTLTGTVAVASTLTGTVTAAGNNTFSPYVVVNYIIKH